MEESPPTEPPPRTLPIHFLVTLLTAWVSIILIGVGAGARQGILEADMAVAGWFLVTPFFAAASASSLARRARFLLASIALACAVVNAAPWIVLVAA